MNIKFIVATRGTAKEFMENTAAGRSFEWIQRDLETISGDKYHVDVILFTNNKRALSYLYNQEIRKCVDAPAILIFVHDDVHIMDVNWASRITNALTMFDIVGVAGNRQRSPGQPNWFLTPDFTPDRSGNLSGSLGHGDGWPPKNVSVFGRPLQKVALLDGLLIACHSKTLIDNNIYFDERFSFHFYDMDLCRQAEKAGLSCGTVDISLVHQSLGGYNSPSWRRSYETYINKWGE